VRDAEEMFSHVNHVCVGLYADLPSRRYARPLRRPEHVTWHTARSLLPDKDRGSPRG
jgi:hypothetical protein